MKSLLLLAGLAGLPTLAFAQSEDTAGPYLGLGTTILTSQPFNQNNGPVLWGPSLTAGIPLSPHLALELSAGYAWNNKHVEYSYVDFSTGRPILIARDTKEKIFTFPLLLRVTLTAPASRLRADILGGATFLHSTFSERETGGGSPYSFDNSSNRAIATLGPGLRFAATPRFELVANALVNYAFFEGGASVSNHLFLNTRLGVHYTFGE